MKKYLEKELKEIDIFIKERGERLEFNYDEYNINDINMEYGFDTWGREDKENHNFDLGYRQAIINSLTQINKK